MFAYTHTHKHTHTQTHTHTGSVVAEIGDDLKRDGHGVIEAHDRLHAELVACVCGQRVCTHMRAVKGCQNMPTAFHAPSEPCGSVKASACVCVCMCVCVCVCMCVCISTQALPRCDRVYVQCEARTRACGDSAPEAPAVKLATALTLAPTAHGLFLAMSCQRASPVRGTPGQLGRALRTVRSGGCSAPAVRRAGGLAPVVPRGTAGGGS